MPKLVMYDGQERGEIREREGEEVDQERDRNQEPERQVQQVKLWKRIGLCTVFAVLPLVLLSIGLAILSSVTTAKVDNVNSKEWTMWLSNTEALKISDITNDELRWYSDNVCIKKVSDKDYQDEVKVSLVKIKCSEVKQRSVYENITKKFTNEYKHRLSFRWTSNTEILLQMSTSLSTANTTRYLSIYVTKTADENTVCEQDRQTIGYLHRWQFNFNGTSSVNTNCTNNNVTAECSSSVYKIDRTDRYIMCMLLSPQDGSGPHEVTYNLHINSREYDLSDTAPYENKECQQLDKTHCCVDYETVLQELYEPTCLFIHNTAPTSYLEAKELSFVMIIQPHKKSDAIVFCWVLVFVAVVPLVAVVVCIIGRIRYHKAHPEQYCVELKIAGRSCLRM